VLRSRVLTCTTGFCDKRSGRCVYRDKVCASEDRCYVGSCNEMTGQCIYLNICINSIPIDPQPIGPIK